MRIILSGGGTGGHIYPAVSVAEALVRRFGSRVEILFVGACGKMEMEKIPALGYKIVGLPVAGFQRRLSVDNLMLPFKVARSLRRAAQVIREFRPDVVVGFGGYASAPILWSAQNAGIPTVIQEQNSYAGVTNKILARRAKAVCVSYDGMERFFDARKIVMTGNPLRGNFAGIAPKSAESLGYFGLTADKPVILVVGGSLGTGTLNRAMLKYLNEIVEQSRVQVIWQTGKIYEDAIAQQIAGRNMAGVWVGAFIDRMDFAFAAADVVISRSGASTVSELELVGKAVIFVPSPNVAEDHQTKNAQALSSVGAAMLISDFDAVDKAIPAALELLDDKARLDAMAAKIKSLGISDSADRVVSQIVRVLDSARK